MSTVLRLSKDMKLSIFMISLFLAGAFFVLLDSVLFGVQGLGFLFNG